MIHFEVHPDLATLAARAAELVATAAETAKRDGHRFRMALSGGRTPETLYRILADSNRIAWAETVLCLGDERAVPPSSPESNLAMALRTLVDPLRQRGAVTPALLSPDGAASDRRTAAADYERQLHKELGDESLDVCLLGLGNDGHTASLFPGSPALAETERWVVDVPAPTTVPPPLPRITLTPALLLRSHQILALVSGADKAAPLARALAPSGDEAACPFRLIHRCHGAVTVLCDQAAASQLPT